MFVGGGVVNGFLVDTAIVESAPPVGLGTLLHVACPTWTLDVERTWGVTTDVVMVDVGCVSCVACVVAGADEAGEEALSPSLLHCEAPKAVAALVSTLPTPPTRSISGPTISCTASGS
jgi:hypothetical protein